MYNEYFKSQLEKGAKEMFFYENTDQNGSLKMSLAGQVFGFMIPQIMSKNFTSVTF